MSQAARKHKLGSTRIRFAMENAVFVATVQSSSDAFDDRVLFLGDEPAGNYAVEVMAIELEGTDNWLVIDAMKMQEKYRDLFEEGKRA